MNRQSRALLTMLIAAAIFVPYWLMTRQSRPGRDAAPAAVRPTRGGTVTTSMRTDPRSFNRIASNQIATDIYAWLTQARLVRINKATQELEPWLAERWDRSADGLTYTVKLRDGLVWSDGTPFTADDVLFSLKAAYDPRSASYLLSALSINGRQLGATAPDARTVVITFPEPFGPGIRLLDNMTIVPRHKLEAAFNAGTFAKAWAAGTPVSELTGLGPFVLTRYDPGQRLVFDRNPRYWRKDDRGEPLPYLDRVVVEIVPDQDAEILRLQSGASDFTQQELRASDIATVRPLVTQGRLQLLELGVSTSPDSLLFNLRPGQWEKDARREWMTKREFRQAISHAVDREAFANTVHLGMAVPIHGPVTPGNTRWFSPNVPRYPFSRERARELLQSIGLTNRDQDEWVEDAQGTDARFTVLVFKGNSLLERSAAVIRDDLRQVGIAMDVVPLEPNAIQQRVLAGEFESCYINLSLTDLDPASTKDFWMSSGGSHYWHIGQQTPATDWERQIDELIAKQAASLDEAERKRLFDDVQRVFAENLPAIYFAAPRIVVAASTRLTNLNAANSRPQLLWSVDTLAVADPTSTARR